MLGAFNVAHAEAGRRSGGSPIGNIRFGGTDNSPRSSSARTITGQVTGTDGKPLAGALVYVRNTHTSNILSIETDAQGAYRFGSLSPAYDYEVWAKDGDKKTPVKIASSFIETTVLNIPLAFDAAAATPSATAAKPAPPSTDNSVSNAESAVIKQTASTVETPCVFSSQRQNLRVPHS